MSPGSPDPPRTGSAGLARRRLGMPIPYEDKSFWLAQYGPYTPNPSLSGQVEADVAIVGGGYTGLSTAFNLRQDEPGLRVVVLESHVVGYGASGRNGGFNMKLFGLGPTVTKALFGRVRDVEAHRHLARGGALRAPCSIRRSTRES